VAYRWSSFFLLIFSLTACSVPPYINIDNEHLTAVLQQRVPIYDIRRPEEWSQTGIIEGSQLLTYIDASGRIQPGFMGHFSKEISQHDPVVLICRSGERTDVLARQLIEQMGYTKVYNVRNGITGWISDKRPVISL